jgi:ectoine hydroxylase-related dioxygenase (phytanoyl-CoA dioxygenase family)
VTRVGKEYLLNARQMAEFVTNGYVVLEQVVPDELNRIIHGELTRYDAKVDGPFWFHSQHIRDVFELPAVRGALQSLVGENPVYDHSAVHKVGPMHLKGQGYHADSIIDTRPLAFDVQAFYFCHDTPDEMGPTLVLPGSHLRRVNTGSIDRYKNIVGQRRLACKAGTIAFMHHGIWHCAQPNHTDTMRYMFKLRLRPGQQQRNLFNTDGYDEPEIRSILYKGSKPWQGNEGRLEHVNRAKLWRYVVGNDSVDVSFEGALTRMGL